MNTYHRFGIITLCLMASFAILGVSLAKATSLSQYAAPQAPTHKIGLAFPNLTSDRFVRDEKVMRQILEDKGYEVISQDANEDANVQNAQIDDMVAQGAKVIIVIAVDSQASATTVESAALAGVKVIAYDRLIKSSSIAAYLSFSGVEVGRQQAAGVMTAADIENWDVAANGKLRLVKLGGSPTDNNAILFRQGQDEILDKYADKIEVVADQWVDNWDPANAQTIMEDILIATGNDIDVVVASNDGTALGALQAMSAQGLAGVVPISGQDATADGCNSIVKGELTVSIFKEIRSMAPHAAELADKLLQGKSDPTLKEYTLAELFNDPSQTGSIMAYFLPVPQVNKDNVYDLVVKSGFQSYDDVYSGIPPGQLPPRPELTVTGIHPTSGPATGGAVVTISGLGYTNPVTVTIGGVLTTKNTVVDSSTIIATSGIHTPGPTDIVVTDPYTVASLSKAFTYLEVVTTTMLPETSSFLTATTNLTTSFAIPSNAVITPTTLIYTDATTPTTPAGFSFAGHGFTLDAYQNGIIVPSFAFSEPVVVTIHYADTDFVGLNESTLVLSYWNDRAWEDAACGDYERHPEENWLRVPICHSSQFALFGPLYHIYLPLVKR